MYNKAGWTSIMADRIKYRELGHEGHNDRQTGVVTWFNRRAKSLFTTSEGKISP